MSRNDIERLVAWFCQVVDGDVPSQAYGVRSAEVIVQGSTEDADPLLALVARHPMSTDQDGFYIRPSQAAIEAIRYRNPKRAAYLRFLSVRGDWEAAGWKIGLDGDESRAYLVAAVRDFYGRYRAKAAGRAYV